MADTRSYIVPFDLDTGGGTELVQGVSLRISAAAGSIEAKGQQAMASSVPVVISSDQSAVNIGSIAGTITPGTAAAELGKAEDVAHASGDVGVMTLGVRDDTPSAATSGATGDYEPLHLDANGALYAILNANSGVTPQKIIQPL